MTEPGIGSDLASMTTTAIRDGDHYVVNGSKTFITNGINADLVITAVKTDPSQRHAGCRLLILERGMAGFERGRNLEKIGMHAQDTAELFFNDVPVPVDEPARRGGRGVPLLVDNLPQERLSIAGPGVAAARAALDCTLEYAKERTAFGQPIGSFQNSRVHARRDGDRDRDRQPFVDRCVLALNAGELTAEEAAMAKWWCTELQKRVIDTLPAAARRLRLHDRVPDRPGLRRRPHHHDLRRHHRDHEGDHRPLARRLRSALFRASFSGLPRHSTTSYRGDDRRWQFGTLAADCRSAGPRSSVATASLARCLASEPAWA